MELPKSIVLTDGNALLPEDGMYLHGVCDAGEHVAVQILQSDLPDLKHAGRLFWNTQLVEVRSEVEATIVQLLIDASCAETPSDAGLVDFVPSPITGAVDLGRLRDRFVQYLQSDQYVDIATNGSQAQLPPWMKWR